MMEFRKQHRKWHFWMSITKRICAKCKDCKKHWMEWIWFVVSFLFLGKITAKNYRISKIKFDDWVNQEFWFVEVLASSNWVFISEQAIKILLSRLWSSTVMTWIAFCQNFWIWGKSYAWRNWCLIWPDGEWIIPCTVFSLLETIGNVWNEFEASRFDWTTKWTGALQRYIFLNIWIKSRFMQVLTSFEGVCKSQSV